MIMKIHGNLIIVFVWFSVFPRSWRPGENRETRTLVYVSSSWVRLHVAFDCTNFRKFPLKI